jgi:hypothetical protein
MSAGESLEHVKKCPSCKGKRAGQRPGLCLCLNRFSEESKDMKKNNGAIAALALLTIFVVPGCVKKSAETVDDSVEAEDLSGVPTFVNEAYMNAPEGVLVGIGAYETGGDPSKIGIGKTLAETRARADISRQLNTIVTDYTIASELDPSAALLFKEDVTITLSKSQLKGAKTVKMDVDTNGTLWVVMEYSKSAAEEEINQAIDAAKLKNPQARHKD